MPGFSDLWFSRAEALRESARDIVHDGLHGAGWEHTSNTPCHRWMWQKTINGVMYSVSDSDAAMIQEKADREAYFKKFPDELGD